MLNNNQQRGKEPSMLTFGILKCTYSCPHKFHIFIELADSFFIFYNYGIATLSPCALTSSEQ